MGYRKQQNPSEKTKKVLRSKKKMYNYLIAQVYIPLINTLSAVLKANSCFNSLFG